MVHKKYITRNGKKFGPYYYENYRENGQVKTRYLGTSLKEDKEKKAKVHLKVSHQTFLTIFMVLCFGFMFLGYMALTGFTITSDDLTSAGTHNNTVYTSSYIELSSADGDQELEDNGVGAGWVDMTDNVLLMHLDDYVLNDTSGAGNQGAFSVDGETLLNPTCDSIPSNFQASGTGATVSVVSDRLRVTIGDGQTGAGVYHLGISNNEGNFTSGSVIEVNVNVDMGNTSLTNAQVTLYGDVSSSFTQISPWETLVQGDNKVYLTINDGLTLDATSVRARLYTVGETSGGNYFSVDNWNTKKIKPTISSGKLGNASNFDGSDSYVSVGAGTNFPNTENDNFTVSLWFKGASDATFSGYKGLIVSSMADGGSDFWQFAGNGTTGYLAWIYEEGGSETSKSVGKKFNNDEWYHLVAVHNGSSNNIYVNGVDTSLTNGATWWTTNHAQFRLGNSESGGDWNGSIDELAIWNRTLSATEILNIYNRQRGTYIDRGVLFKRCF